MQYPQRTLQRASQQTYQWMPPCSAPPNQGQSNQWGYWHSVIPSGPPPARLQAYPSRSSHLLPADTAKDEEMGPGWETFKALEHEIETAITAVNKEIEEILRGHYPQPKRRSRSLELDSLLYQLNPLFSQINSLEKPDHRLLNEIRVLSDRIAKTQLDLVDSEFTAHTFNHPWDMLNYTAQPPNPSWQD